MRSFLLTLLVAAVGAQAQPGCPAVNFQTAVSATLPSTATSQTVLLRQSDGSYAAYEMATQSPYRIIRTIPNYQKQLTACLPSHSSLPPLGPPPAVGSGPGAVGPTQGFVRLSSGNYLALMEETTGKTSATNVVLFDPQLNVISQAPLPIDIGGVGIFADVNGDGKLDIVGTTGTFNGKYEQAQTLVQVLVGDGGVNFHIAGGFPLPGNYSGKVAAVADLNGDHKLDVIVVGQVPVGSAGKISVFLGNGDGTFQAEKVVYSSENTPQGIAVADFNEDGKADLAYSFVDTTTVSPFEAKVDVALGKGDGTFATPTSYLIADAESLSVGDMDGDGFLDTVTSGVSILYGDGTGAFPRRLDYMDPAAGSVVLTDVDGDGRLDVVIGGGNAWAVSGSAAAAPSGSISVLFGWNNGTFFGPKVSLTPVDTLNESGLSVPLATGDFNGDGIPDIVTENTTGITVLAGDGRGGFSSVYDYDLGASGFPGATNIVTGDFNGDGKQDFAIGFQQNLDSGTLAVFLGKGDGTFQSPMSSAVPPGAVTLVTGDFNGDGKVDLALMTSSIIGLVSAMNNTKDAVLMLLGKGDGTFTPSVTYPVGPFADMIAAGDFDGDGKPDLAVVNASGGTTDTSSTIGLLFGKGDGTFTAGTSIPLAYLESVAAGDFNGDGKLDLAALTDSGVAILLGHGDGTFGGPRIFPASSGNWIVAADLNGDKIPDLVDGTTYLLGNGDGTFQPPLPLIGTYSSTGQSPYPLVYFTPPVAVDLNGDGKVDVVGPFPIGVVSFLNISQAQAAVTVVSAASFAIGPVAPESLAAAFGKDLAASTAAAPEGQAWPTTLGNTTVSVQDASGTTRAAELLYVSPGQVNFVIPAGTSSGGATVTITTERLFTNQPQTAQVQIAPIDPAMFVLNAGGLAAGYVTLTGPAPPPLYESLFTLQNGIPVAAPVSLGTASQQASLTLFGTGLRNAAAGGVTVEIQGVNAPVTSAGPVSGINGLDQVTVALPRTLAGSGDVNIVVTAAGMTANTVQVTIQ